MIRHSLQIFIGQLDKLLNHLHILENLDSVSEEIQASNLVDDIKNHAISVLRKNVTTQHPYRKLLVNKA